MRVLIPSALTSYTRGATELEAHGRSIGEVLEELDRRFPGLRFRVVDEQDGIRTHMRVFVNGRSCELSTAVADTDEVAILMALSGG